MKSSERKPAKFTFGSFVYHYDLVREERKTLGLTVMPNLSIYLKSPHEASAERIDLFLKRKWFWLEKQLNFFRKHQRKMYTKEYISGESFLYLGRQYELLVRSAVKPKVVLSKKSLALYTDRGLSDGARNKRILDAWYAKRIGVVFAERLAHAVKKFGYQAVPELIIREMPRRWGSFLSTEKIILNPRLIFTSKECIDYVITHELCHWKFKNHNRKFFALLEKQYPKWKKVKEKLEMYGI